MQIRALVAVGARTLYTSTVCQSTLLRLPYLPAGPPNAPLGAGLCIFNKFQESSKPVISAGGCSEGGFSAASQTVSSRLFMCEELAILLSTLLLPHPRHSTAYFPFDPLPVLLLSCRSRTLFLYLSFCLSLLFFFFSSSFSFFFLSPHTPYLFLSRFRAASFSSVFFLLLIFFFYFSFSSSLSTLFPTRSSRLSHPRCSFSRALSRRGVNSSLEHGQQDNACLLKTSF